MGSHSSNTHYFLFFLSSLFLDRVSVTHPGLEFTAILLPQPILRARMPGVCHRPSAIFNFMGQMFSQLIFCKPPPGSSVTMLQDR